MSALGIHSSFAPRDSSPPFARARFDFLAQMLQQMLGRFPGAPLAHVVYHLSAVLNALPHPGAFSSAGEGRDSPGGRSPGSHHRHSVPYASPSLRAPDSVLGGHARGGDGSFRALRREDLISLSWKTLHRLCCARGFRARRKRSCLTAFLSRCIADDPLSVPTSHSPCVSCSRVHWSHPVTSGIFPAK